MYKSCTDENKNSLAGQMFVVHQMKRVERPVTTDRFSWMSLVVCCLCSVHPSVEYPLLHKTLNIVGPIFFERTYTLCILGELLPL